MTRFPTTTRSRIEACAWMTQSSPMRAPAPITVLGYTMVRAPMEAPALLPRADDQAGRGGHRFAKLPLENRAHLGEEPFEVLVVVDVLALLRRLVGLENGIDQLVTGEQRVESGIARVQDGRRRRG